MYCFIVRRAGLACSAPGRKQAELQDGSDYLKTAAIDVIAAVFEIGENEGIKDSANRQHPKAE